MRNALNKTAGFIASIAFFSVSSLASTVWAGTTYGGVNSASLRTLATGAIAEGLASVAVSPWKPIRMPTWTDTALAFAWLSTAEMTYTSGVPADGTAPSIPRGTRPGQPVPQVSFGAWIQRLIQPAPNRITIGWALDSGTQSLESDLATSPGLTVLAPKWFHVDGLQGAIAGQVEPAVVTAAHRRGVQVWAVVDNGFDGIFTHKILQYRDEQDILIRHIVSLSMRNHLDGINLDFEGLLPEDRWNFSRFVNVLAASLHAAHKSLSVDLPPDIVMGQNDGPYNHRAIAQAADKVVLMGYDEHWGGDSLAGPTASLPWVTSAVTDMLQTGVPHRKLILGVPFYTQEWTVDAKGQVVASQALSLSQLDRLVRTKQLHPVWRPQLGLHYTAFTTGSTRQEIWLEDNRSLLLSLHLVSQYDLGGAAAWYLGLARPSTWTALVQSVRSPIA